MFEVKINTSGDAFVDEPEQEVARLLGKITARLYAGETEGALLDFNGNMCGSWQLTLS